MNSWNFLDFRTQLRIWLFSQISHISDNDKFYHNEEENSHSDTYRYIFSMG